MDCTVDALPRRTPQPLFISMDIDAARVSRRSDTSKHNFMITITLTRIVLVQKGGERLSKWG